ncbi:MAG TPA: YerC/YecD family TrpR-related protein [Steroidobacteraceae bacterium]|nr:YerC/YecD family TrpR-related protein [Steroidobacteraceae bacterium]
MKVHRNVSESQEALAERNLFAAVASLRSADECRAFFRDLCTPAEIQAMADRWAVVDWLARGVPYREINRLTGVSVTTISRVARCLGDDNGGYSLVIRRTQGNRRTRRTESARRVEAARNG